MVFGGTTGGLKVQTKTFENVEPVSVFVLTSYRSHNSRNGNQEETESNVFI